MNSRKLGALLITTVLHGLVLAGLIALSDAPRQRTPPEPLRVALLTAASPQQTPGAANGEPAAAEATAVARPDDAVEQSVAPVPPPAVPPVAEPPPPAPPVAEPPPPPPPAAEPPSPAAEPPSPAAEPPAAAKPLPAPKRPAPVRKPDAKVAPATPSPRAPPRPERTTPRERPAPREPLPTAVPSPSPAMPPATAAKPVDEAAASDGPPRASADPTKAASAVGPAPSAPVPAAAVRKGPRVDASWSGNQPPPYPMLARRMGEEGEVLLDVHVGRDGRVTEVRLRQSSGSDLLDRTAIDTVRQWRFQPATVDGQPVAEWYRNWKWVFRLKS